MISKINIVQHGSDGMGHQLHGLLSCLGLHNINNYYFDGFIFINKFFNFEHINIIEALDVKNYFIEIIRVFIIEYNLNVKNYKNHVHSHEIYNIPKDYESETIYSLDNCYFFNKIPIDNNEMKEYINNIQKIKKFFVNEKLPKKRLCDDNIVIHIRQGDALITDRVDNIIKHNKQLLNIIPKLVEKYSQYKFYIHSDGDITFLTDILMEKKINYVNFVKNEHILNVLSDFIYSKIFITGHSSLSTVCTFLGDHEVIIVPDDINHSLPNNIIRISDYK